MSDAPALERNDTETEAAGPGLRVPFNAHAASHSHADSRDSHNETRARARRTRLTKLLLAKLTLDLLFVAALAVYTHAVAFPPFYSGSLDHADGLSVRGWVVDRAAPDKPVEVQLYVDGRFFAAGVADQPRPDVAEKGFAPDERHGFVFTFERDLYGEHEARVYAVHSSAGGRRRTLQQIGRPLAFAWKGAARDYRLHD
jgi:hypothetical protein